MPILFNQPNSDSLLDVIKKEINQILIKPRERWVFYAITCYFTDKAIKTLVEEVKKLLENSLCEIHILVDANEWIKSLVDKDELIRKINEITGLNPKSISFTPIRYSNKLFHAKSYALINLQILECNTKNNGFAIITSGNLTNSGLKENIEIGQIIDSGDSLREFVNLFFNLKNNYAVSSNLEKEQKKVQLAVKVLSRGVFYHQWRYDPDLTVRLELSAEEKKRLKELAKNEETRKKIEDFKLKQTEKITKNPIKIQSIFDICPKPIPPDIWGSYSIDTPLGQWVPLKISELIEDEVKNSRKIFIPLLKERGDGQKIQQHTEELKDYVKRKIQEITIEFSLDNWSEADNWNKKVKRFFQDENLLNTFICDYEKIYLPIKTLESEVILGIYERIKDFYYSPDSHKSLGKVIANLGIDNADDCERLDHRLSEMAEKVEEILKANRLGDLYKLIIKGNDDAIKEGESFTAFQISGNSKDEYKRLDGFFEKITNPKDDPILHYKTLENQKKELPIISIRTFKKISEQRRQDKS